MTYKNMKKIDEILYNIDCLILDRNKYFEDLDFYYEDGRQCKIIEYDWSQDGKWSNIRNITIYCLDGEVIENVSAYSIYLTEESLEKYGWYFKEDDY